MDSDVTAKFQNAIPFALRPISPALSALHTRRIRTGEPISSETCQKCGFYLFAGDSSTRVVRTDSSKRRRKTSGGIDKRSSSSSSSSTRARQSTCLHCGSVTEFPLPSSLFPKRKAYNLEVEQPSITVATSSDSSADPKKVQAVAAVSTFSGPDTPAAPVKSKSRPKKKSGLQEILAQNRAKEEKTKKSSNTDQSNLVAFLDSL